MTVTRDAVEGDVKIRSHPIGWMPILLLSGWMFVQAFEESRGAGVQGPDKFYVILGSIMLVEAWWLATFGVDLTPELARIRGLRRRNVPWNDVQAVIPCERFGSRVVQLILENGESVMMRAPSTSLGVGRARYERDYNRIGQWWLAHRGESWRPLRPEAPRPPAPHPGL
jgi:hypothetical protein